MQKYYLLVFSNNDDPLSKTKHMMKAFRVAILATLGLPITGSSQCATAPPPPPCTGTETQVVADETLTAVDSKWYSGAASTLNSLTISGGTLVVCGDLTIDKFYMDSGTVIVQPGARFVIGSGLGSGLILRGNSAIYNYGICEIQRNLSLESGWASAAKPNLIINATGASVFRMSNQYLVINNSNSWFVNNGDAEFWGTIQEAIASPGAVCLGDGSSTRMAVQINKATNAYTVPSGSACVQVRQYSQFYAPFTAESGLRVCLATGHSSDSGCIPFGCTPNNWGAASLLIDCTDCASFAVLEVSIYDWRLEKSNNGAHRLQWRASNLMSGAKFRILRSANGSDFVCIDSIVLSSTANSFFTYTDRSPLAGDNFYMIQYLDTEHSQTSNSKALRINSSVFQGIRIYPVPFSQFFYIEYDQQQTPRQIMLSDINGKNMRLYWYVLTEQNRIRVQVLDPLPGEIYLLHIKTDQSTMSRTILHR